jgi:putative transposase
MTKSDKVLQFETLGWRQAEAPPADPGHADPLSHYRACLPALDDQIEALLARGASLQGVQKQLSLLYGIKFATDHIGACIDTATAEARDWSQRALDPLFPIVVFDSMRIKLREAKAWRNRSCLFALGMRPSGNKEVLGFWLDDGPKPPWPAVMQDLTLRGVEDVLIFVSADPNSRAAMAAAFPEAERLVRIVELIRRSLEFASSQNRAAVSSALKEIYCAADAASGFTELQAFSQSAWGRRYPVIASLWQRDWAELSSLFALPVDIRRIVGSTFAMDGLQRNLRRAIRARGEFSSADEALTLLALVSRASQKHWKRPHRDWHRVKTQLALRYPARFGAEV